MTAGQSFAVAGGLVLALSAAAGGIVAHERAIGARDATIAQLQVTAKAQAVTIQRDSALLAHHDTALVFRNVVKSDTVLQRIIDSAIVHHSDTVWVTREVLVEAKATIDSTKKVADACCQLARDYKARAHTLDSLNTDLLKQIPSAGKAWLDRGEGVLACAGSIWLAGKLKAP